jgi:Fur family peroxide stress response transcriptional regulator
VKFASNTSNDYESAVGHGDLRDTPQRRHVYDQLLERRDHPTATEVFIRAKQSMPSISLATVYNSLETLVACGLVKQVHVDREPTRYCPNLEEHGHFICDRCSHVFDVDLASGHTMGGNWNLPAGFTVSSYEVSLRGVCPTCNSVEKS